MDREDRLFKSLRETGAVATEFAKKLDEAEARADMLVEALEGQGAARGREAEEGRSVRADLLKGEADAFEAAADMVREFCCERP